jgi:hypothetical protein
MANVHVGVPVWLRVTVTEDGTTPVALTAPVVFRLAKPNNAGSIDVTATVVGDGTAGQAEALTTLGPSGSWKLEVRRGSPVDLISDAVTFTAVANLAAP